MFTLYARSLFPWAVTERSIEVFINMGMQRMHIFKNLAFGYVIWEIVRDFQIKS